MSHWITEDLKKALDKARSEGILSVLRILPQYIARKRENLPSSPTTIKYNEAVVTIIPNRSSCERSLYRNKEYEPEIDKLITQTLSSGDTAIDVGAHVGHHTVSMRLAVGESGRVLSIEPDLSRMNILKQTIQNNRYENVKLIEVGVSDKSETTKLDRSSVPQIASGSIERDTSSTTIQTTSLDELLENENISDVDLIKMDIEGHEAKALAGISIERVDTLIIEVHPGALAKEELENLTRELREFDKIINIETDERITNLQSTLTPENSRLHLYCENDPKWK